MHYESFTFRNFKGVGDVSLDLSVGSPTTLVGLNESGKTTLLEAMYCFAYGQENLEMINPELQSLRDPEDWVPIAARGNFNDHISIRAQVCLSTSDRSELQSFLRQDFGLRTEIQGSISIEERYVFNNSRHEGTERTWSLKLEGTKGRERIDRRYTNKTEEWIAAVEFIKERLPSIFYYPNFLFDLPSRFHLEEATAAPNPQLSQGSNQDVERQSFYRQTFQAILDSVSPGAELSTHIASRIRSGDDIDARNVKQLLLQMENHITDTIVSQWNQIFDRNPSGNEVNLDYGHADGIAYLELKIKGQNAFYSISEKSLGFRWFFMFLLMTSYRRETDASKQSVILLDEPASNLHSGAQAELLRSFEGIANRSQLVYTTHSHHLIGLRWLDSAVVVANEALGDLSVESMIERNATESSITATKYRRFVSENPSRISYFQPIMDLLDYRPSDLELVPRALIVEGKSDLFLLKYLASHDPSTIDFAIVPGTSASALDTLISLFSGWSSDFVVLLDGDKEGAKQRTRYRETYGPLVDGRITVLSEILEDEAVRKIEDLLDDATRSALLGKPQSTAKSDKKEILRAAMERYAAGDRIVVSEPVALRVADLAERVNAMLSHEKLA